MSESGGDSEDSAKLHVPVLLPRGIVFVVDDEDGVRRAVSDVLEQNGYLALPARDGVEGLARLAGFRGRGVLLLDLSMPRMDGIAFLGELERNRILQRLAVVVVSGRKHLPALPYRVLRKPFTSRELVAAVEESFAAIGNTQ